MSREDSKERSFSDGSLTHRETFSGKTDCHEHHSDAALYLSLLNRADRTLIDHGGRPCFVLRVGTLSGDRGRHSQLPGVVAAPTKDLTCRE